jgi:hypothetical protein
MNLNISCRYKQGLRDVRWSPGQSEMWDPHSIPKAIYILNKYLKQIVHHPKNAIEYLLEVNNNISTFQLNGIPAFLLT